MGYGVVLLFAWLGRQRLVWFVLVWRRLVRIVLLKVVDVLFVSLVKVVVRLWLGRRHVFVKVLIFFVYRVLCSIVRRFIIWRGWFDCSWNISLVVRWVVLFMVAVVTFCISLLVVGSIV